MPRNIIVFAAAAVIILCSISFGFCEDLTITTYYPSPNGSYQDLRVSNSLGVGSTASAWLDAHSPNNGMIVTGGTNAGLTLLARNGSNSFFTWFNQNGTAASLADSSGTILFEIRTDRNVYIRSPSARTADPLNGVAPADTSVIRYCDNNHNQTIGCP